MKTIKALGRMVDREAAYEAIETYWIACLYCPQDIHALRGMLFSGWKPLKEWTDAELQAFVDEFCDEEHQRDGANYRESAASLNL